MVKAHQQRAEEAARIGDDRSRDPALVGAGVNIADNPLALGDDAFADAWRAMPEDEKRKLADAVRSQCIDRYRRLTPYVDASIAKADRDNRRLVKPAQAVLNGAELLDRFYLFLGRFVAYPSEDAHVAHSLWCAHTHFMEKWESTPRIAFLSPEPGSGKTRALEISETLVPRPVEAINATPAYLFRKVNDPAGTPTVLYDEIDTLFGPKAKDNEEIRGILNAGHRRGAMAGRCVVRGRIIETEELPAYCAVALAGLGNLPDTILTRSVVIRMRRRAPTEVVEPYRRRVHAPQGNALRDQLAAWAPHADVSGWPDMPPGIQDRDADVWEALLAVADAAGKDWPARARVAAVALVALAKAGSPSLGVRLLGDLRKIFGEREAMGSEEIVRALVALDESPWADMRGKAIDQRRLATYLRPYGVKPKGVRIGDSTPRGYAREDLYDPWVRYLGEPARGCATSATCETPGDICPRCAGEGCRWCEANA